MKRCAVSVLALLLVLLFCPAAAEELSVTRTGFFTLLWCASGAPEAQSPAPFTDIASQSPGEPAAAWAFEVGLSQGTGHGTFSPDRPVTREEAAVLLRRYAQYTGLDANFPEGPAHCNDNQDISPWADDSLYWATMTGILDWSEGGRMAPGGTLTAQEAATALGRLLKRVS